MSEELSRLAERRKRLVEEAAIQREVVAQEVDDWRPVVKRVDQGIAIGRYLRKHPPLLAATGLVAATIGPGRIWKWLGRGILAWRLEKFLFK